MKNLGIFLGLSCCALGLLVSGCDDIPGERLVFPVGGDGVPGFGYPKGQGVGDDCATKDCRSGLMCSAGDLCEPSGSLDPFSPCTIGPECKGAHCVFEPTSQLSLCVEPESEGEVGETCQTDLDCQVGLKCSLMGFATACLPAGEGDIGAPCVQQTDCFQGLYCTFESDSPAGVCSLPTPPLGPPLWQGVDCPEQDDQNVEALFYLPGADGTPDDATFFDHPFPSDVRLGSDGRPDLDGFPTPGPGLLGVDMVAAYVDAVQSDTHGWSTNPVVYFRFSGAISIESLETPEAGPRRVVIADVDALPGDNTIAPPSLSTQYSIGSGSNYICDDWFALKTPRDTLVPGHRYVAWITTDARTREGNDPVARSPQFEAMLGESRPLGDAVLADAYDDFAPLREFLAFYEGSANEVDPDSILIATVFTTDDPIAPMRALSEAVFDEEVPNASDWVLCDGENESPCAQADAGESRACGSGATDYDEYQALIELPIFQRGSAPYLASGGDIAGTVQRTEPVCMSMSIPRNAEEPEGGWPLVIYGHGTGGSYRGALRDSVAGELARTSPAFATLGYDAVQHGPRRGEGEGADNDPENLFFNFVNPDAARGNPLQGAADILSVLRFAQTGNLATAAETGGGAIRVDPAKVLYYGHSQGSTHGSMAVPFSNIAGTVLSGNGGGLAEALMNKSNPVDIAGSIPFVIQDADAEGNLRLGSKHPVLSLLQHYIDPADPINFAPLFTIRPEEGQEPKHIFQTFGLDDTYAPPTTLASFVYASELDLAAHPSGVSPTGNNDLRLTPQSEPVTDNFSFETGTVTAVCRQYAPPSGSDGHFVVDDVAEANADAIGFLESLGNGVSPIVPAP